MCICVLCLLLLSCTWVCNNWVYQFPTGPTRAKFRQKGPKEPNSDEVYSRHTCKSCKTRAQSCAGSLVILPPMLSFNSREVAARMLTKVSSTHCTRQRTKFLHWDVGTGGPALNGSMPCRVHVKPQLHHESLP